jgi:hypothetical protein
VFKKINDLNLNYWSYYLFLSLISILLSYLTRFYILKIIYKNLTNLDMSPLLVDYIIKNSNKSFWITILLLQIFYLLFYLIGALVLWFILVILNSKTIGYRSSYCQMLCFVIKPHA